MPSTTKALKNIYHLSNIIYECYFLPDAEELCGALWGGDGQLDLVLFHGDLGIERALMVHVGVHLNSGYNEFRDMDSHLSHKLNSNRGCEQQLILCTKTDHMKLN